MSHASVSWLKLLKWEPPAPVVMQHLLSESQTAISVESGGKKATRKKFCQKLQQQSCETRKEAQQILQSLRAQQKVASSSEIKTKQN